MNVAPLRDGTRNGVRYCRFFNGRGEMTMLDEEDEILFKRLKSALASLDAAFPAGDYHLNKRQNLAINELLDISFDMTVKYEFYKKEVESARKAANEERIAEISKRYGK